MTAHAAPTPAAPPPPAVTVAKPQIRQVVDEDEYVGRFVAQNAVEIRARVSGYLEQVLTAARALGLPDGYLYELEHGEPAPRKPGTPLFRAPV